METFLNSNPQEAGINNPPEVTISQIDLENPLVKERLAVIDTDPQAKRHLLPPEEGTTLIDRLSSESTYGIITTDADGAEALGTVSYFYPYEEIEDSETIPDMIETGMLPNDIIPRTETGEVDYSRINEVSINIPSDFSNPIIIGKGLNKIVDQYTKDAEISPDSLLFFFQLREQNQSAADPNDYASPETYEAELRVEEEILKQAGFTYRGPVEAGAVGVFTLTH